MIGFLKGTVTPQDGAVVGGIIFLTVVLFAAFYFVAVQSMEAQIKVLDAEYAALAGSVKKAREIKENIEDLRSEAMFYEELVTKFEQRLPEQREIPQMLRQFEAIANSINLQVRLSSMTPETGANKETIPFRVTAFGDFHQIVEFINELEREDRYFKITDLDIGEQVDNKATAAFVLSTFRFIQRPTS